MPFTDDDRIRRSAGSANLEREIKILNEWVEEVRQNLPLVVTKDDLRALATTEQLKALATKEELKRLATKEELRALATKDDVEASKRYTENLILVTRREIRQLADLHRESEAQRRVMRRTHHR